MGCLGPFLLLVSRSPLQPPSAHMEHVGFRDKNDKEAGMGVALASSIPLGGQSALRMTLLLPSPTQLRAPLGTVLN